MYPQLTTLQKKLRKEGIMKGVLVYDIYYENNVTNE